jgi:cytochrome c oxidase assembly protein subunit 11
LVTRDAKSAARAGRRTAIKLAVVAVGMFGFGFALVPLYDLACKVVGINGKTGRIEAGDLVTVDTARTITVELAGQATTGLPWEFRPMTRRVQLHPGETVVVKYFARNTATEPLVGQAVPSVAPGRAAPYFKKIECFCFSRQKLKPGESREMPVQFTVLPGVAPEVQTVTLSYAFFNADEDSARKYESASVPVAARYVRGGTRSSDS